MGKKLQANLERIARTQREKEFSKLKALHWNSSVHSSGESAVSPPLNSGHDQKPEIQETYTMPPARRKVNTVVLPAVVAAFAGTKWKAVLANVSGEVWLKVQVAEVVPVTTKV